MIAATDSSVPNPLYSGKTKTKKKMGGLLGPDRHDDNYEKYARLKTKNSEQLTAADKEAEYERRMRRQQELKEEEAAQAAAAESKEQQYAIKHVMMVTEVSETRARELLEENGNNAVAAIDALRAEQAAEESEAESSDGESVAAVPDSASALAKVRKRGPVLSGRDLTVGDELEYLDSKGIVLGTVTIEALDNNVPDGEEPGISIKMPNGNVRETIAERLRWPGKEDKRRYGRQLYRRPGSRYCSTSHMLLTPWGLVFSWVHRPAV